MSKIEITDLNSLIRQGYPYEVIKKLIDEVLIISMQVKTDYPDYKSWFLTKQVSGLYDNTRNIIVAHIDGKLVGFTSLKKTEDERKICTFYVEKRFRKNQIGSRLVEKSIEFLETEQPLITIPMDKLNEFVRIGNKYNWKVTDIIENLYRINNPEVIVNGELIETNLSTETVNKTLSKVYRDYRFITMKESIKIFINRICENNI